jgi:hypothetical protein
MNTQALIMRISSIFLLFYAGSIWSSQATSSVKAASASQVSINDLLVKNPALLYKTLRDLLAQDPLQLGPSMLSAASGQIVFKDKSAQELYQADLAQLKMLRAELPTKNS